MHSIDQHRAEAPAPVACHMITVSDTRTYETDTGGPARIARLQAARHPRELVPDDPRQLRDVLQRVCREPAIQAVLITGGTGIGAREQTCETVAAALTKTMPGSPAAVSLAMDRVILPELGHLVREARR